ncbi:putative membrane protein [Leucobacter luti]|uniref:cytochrome c oxidase assembly protein n=1 Tax=Leucobacter luti TaxID=340320 RepID=UPI0010F2225C|nr:cytochrome c oxidase assembly protein [Leucobacter luti]MCW2288663.1 putative membrane protein [Leucobacter luti]TCK45181.1 putative membrane protein [Leucobacter luti]
MFRVLPANVGASDSSDLSDLVQFDPLSASPLAWLAVATLVMYLIGAITLWVQGKRWGIGSTLSFVAGCTLWFAATGLSLNAYAGELVSVLLFQHITLMVAVPPLLLMGAPGRLLLRTTPRQGIGRPVLRVALTGQRSRISYALLHPAVAIVVAGLAFPALYFTDAVSWILAVPGGHLILLTLLFVSGVIAAAPLWSLDQLPRTPSYVVRLIDVVIEIQIHALFGLILLRAGGALFSWYSDEPEEWGITRALDQAIGGGLVWSYGELPLLIVLIVTLSKWRTSDLRAARHRQPQEDADLDEYNAYLAAVAAREGQPQFQSQPTPNRETQP